MDGGTTQCLPAATVTLLTSLQLYTHKSQIRFQVFVCCGTVGKHYVSPCLNNYIIISLCRGSYSASHLDQLL